MCDETKKESMKKMMEKCAEKFIDTCCDSSDSDKGCGCTPEEIKKFKTMMSDCDCQKIIKECLDKCNDSSDSECC
ncbi:hypothetical protein ACFL2A_05440 [Thermodesulfobacteriota bacterium]